MSYLDGLAFGFCHDISGPIKLTWAQSAPIDRVLPNPFTNLLQCLMVKPFTNPPTLNQQTPQPRNGSGKAGNDSKPASWRYLRHMSCAWFPLVGAVSGGITPIQAHSLPSACRAESCLLCCQPEPSLSRYLPDYHELLHDSLADCKLKGDELST